jgi:hypothetical protein
VEHGCREKLEREGAAAAAAAGAALSLEQSAAAAAEEKPAPAAVEELAQKLECGIWGEAIKLEEAVCITHCGHVFSEAASTPG